MATVDTSPPVRAGTLALSCSPLGFQVGWSPLTWQIAIPVPCGLGDYVPLIPLAGGPSGRAAVAPGRVCEASPSSLAYALPGL